MEINVEQQHVVMRSGVYESEMDQLSLQRKYDRNDRTRVRELLIPLIDFNNQTAQGQAAAGMLAWWLLVKPTKRNKRSKKDPVQITIEVPTPGLFWVLDLLNGIGALSKLN